MNTEYLSCFLMAAKYLNITEAANRLFISASTASRQISHLEEEFGLELFSRQAGNLTLTKEGTLFLKYAHKMMDSYDEAKLAVRQMQAPEKEELRITVLNMSFA